MATAEGVKAKLQGLIATANATTGNSDTDLTAAINALVAGFGQGGGGGGASVPFVLDVTGYTLSESWENNTTGNTLNFAQVFCNYDDTTDFHPHVCFITNNTATQNYRADYVLYQRQSSSSVICLNFRNNWTSPNVGAASSRSFWISAGAKITVIRFAYGANEVDS